MQYTRFTGACPSQCPSYILCLLDDTIFDEEVEGRTQMCLSVVEHQAPSIPSAVSPAALSHSSVFKKLSAISRPHGSVRARPPLKPPSFISLRMQMVFTYSEYQTTKKRYTQTGSVSDVRDLFMRLMYRTLRFVHWVSVYRMLSSPFGFGRIKHLVGSRMR